MRLAMLLVLMALAIGPVVAAELPREQLVLRSALSVDADAHTVTLPLHRGRTTGGGTVWYILMDSSDAQDAAARGLVHAPLLKHAGHVQIVGEQGGQLVFAAAPDFSAVRRLQPGAQGFPPAEAMPGATAPAAYSPFIRRNADGPVLNAPIIATGDGPFDLAGHTNTADRVLAIDTAKGTVTLLLSHGFAEGRRVAYISTEASDPMAAALERATLVPQLGKGDADIGLLVFMAGPEQGMAQALTKGGLGREATLQSAPSLGAPLNILMAFPMGRTASGYSPLWRITLAKWTAGIAPQVVTGQDAFWRLVSAKQVTGSDGAAPGPADFVVNCPVIAWLDGPVP